MQDFCPLINDRCNHNCVILEKKPHASGYGLVDYCSFAKAIKNSEIAVISELKKIANKNYL